MFIYIACNCLEPHSSHELGSLWSATSFVPPICCILFKIVWVLILGHLFSNIFRQNAGIIAWFIMYFVDWSSQLWNLWFSPQASLGNWVDSMCLSRFQYSVMLSISLNTYYLHYYFDVLNYIYNPGLLGLCLNFFHVEAHSL